MEVYEARRKSVITEEEKESIKRYLGFVHTGMNILADLTPESYKQLEKSGWYLPKSEEEVKEKIEDFVNIYSAMYKNRNNYRERNLVRGTSVSRVEKLGSQFNQMISTSTDEYIAKRFTEYENGALIHFQVGNGVPFLNAEEFREEYNESEKEIIIAPFCTINNIQKSDSTEGFQHYNISIGAPRLQEKSQEELTQLTTEVIGGFSQNIENIKEYSSLQDKIEWLDRQYKIAGLEDRKEIASDKQKVLEEYSEKSKEIEDFRNKLQTLLKGLCRQKEREFDKAKEVIAQDKVRQVEEAEKRRQEEAKIAEEQEIMRAEQLKKDRVQEIISKAEKNPQNAQNLNSQITSAYQELLNNERIYKQKADILGITYTKLSSNTKIAERVKAIQSATENVQEILNGLNVTEDDSRSEVAGVYKRVIPLMDGINFGAIQAEDLSEIVKLHITQSENEIKKNLYNKVQKTIQNAKIQKYMEERDSLSNEKIGLWGRLTGKQELQDEKINQLNLKIQLAQTMQPEEQEKYSVRDMLADILVCSKTELDGNPTYEMLNLYTTINQNFGLNGKSFSDEEINNLADKKIEQQQNKLPVPAKDSPRFFGKTKFQINSLKEENTTLRKQVMEQAQKRNMSYIKVLDNQDAIAAFDSKLNSIQKITTDKQNQVDRDGPTAELW